MLSNTQPLAWIDTVFAEQQNQPGFDVHGDWGIPAQAKASLEAVAGEVCFVWLIWHFIDG